MAFSNISFPFTAIVGQEKMKRALIINAINPSIGGLLIKGERGTGKSTAARALAQLLPEIDVVADCPFSCHPHDINLMCENCANRALESDSLKVETRKVKLVELPLNISEDRLVGTIDIERVLKHGEKQFEPGVLARANRSILYIDEVNLLDDHIVDLLLDAAAMGVNVVEREGVSFSHPARFIMIGTMNPEEGELRPQLEDRFGLCVKVQGEKDYRARAEIVRKMRSFQDNPLFFVSEYQEAEEALRDRILKAQKMLDNVELPEAMLELITFISVELKVCGHRADITMMNAAITLAALDEKGEVEVEHVREAAELSLLHRLRRDPFEEKPTDISRIDDIIEEKQSHKGARPLPSQWASWDGEDFRNKLGNPVSASIGEGKEAENTEPPSLEQAKRELEILASALPKLEVNVSRITRNGDGKRAPAMNTKGRGRYVGNRIPPADQGEEIKDIAFDATIRAAAKRSKGIEDFAITKEDLRIKVRRRKAGTLILFVVDASASMGAHARMESIKLAILTLLKDAYQKRDRVGLICFRDHRAFLTLHPTTSAQLASVYLKTISTGGATPLSHGLSLSLQTIKKEMAKDPELLPIMVLITDGHGNVALGSADPLKESLALAQEIRAQGIRSLVIDTYQNGLSQKKQTMVGYPARRIAEALGGDYHRLDFLKPEKIVRYVEDKRNP